MQLPFPVEAPCFTGFDLRPCSTLNLPIMRQMLGVGPEGSRPIQPAQVDALSLWTAPDPSGGSSDDQSVSDPTQYRMRPLDRTHVGVPTVSSSRLGTRLRRMPAC